MQAIDLKIRANPSNWNVISNSGGVVSAQNRISNEIFNGSLVAFQNIFKIVVPENDEVKVDYDVSGNVARLMGSGGSPIELGGGASGGYDRQITGTATFVGGNVLIALGQPITGASIAITPVTGAVGVDYTADATPHVSTGNWVAVYGGDISANEVVDFSTTITGIRLRPIASGANIDYVVTAPGSDYFVTDAITFAGGNVLVTLPEPMNNVSVFILSSAGEIGLDYTTDATPHVTTGAWTALYGGDFAINDSTTISARITGLRFRPIAAGAAAEYQVRA
jgi:hypothetical protein